MDAKQFLRAQEQWLDPDLHYWSAGDEVEVEEPPTCEYCPAEGGEEHNGGCPNSDNRHSNIRAEDV